MRIETMQWYLPRVTTGEGLAIAKLQREQIKLKEEIKSIQKKMLNARNMLSLKDVYRQQAKIEALELKIELIRNEIHELQEV